MVPCIQCPNNNNVEGDRFCQSGGMLDSGIVILGESPGNQELNLGEECQPFVGRAGNILTEIMEEINPPIALNNCCLINSINCDITSWDSSDRAGIATFCAFKCRERVLDEIFSEERSVILALGNSNLRSLLDSKKIKIGDERGWGVPLARAGFDANIQIMYTFHPTYANRFKNPDNEHHNIYENFSQDVRDAIEYYQNH